MTDQPALRVGVIGAGNIATLAHIPGLLHSGAADVAAICDRDIDRAEAAAERFGIRAVFGDYQQMLEMAPLDAVTVATPPLEHAPATVTALAAGLHVLCEKPLATNLSDAVRMVEVAEEAGLVLAMNMHFRVLRESVALKAAVDAGQFGQLSAVHIRYLRNDFFPPPGSWANVPDVSGGGALADMGSHLIDLALWLTGSSDATLVDADLRRTDRTTTGTATEPGALGEDFASIRMRTDAGATVSIECSWGYFGPDESRIQLIGSRGGADVAAVGSSSPALRFYSIAEDGHVSPARAPAPGHDAADLVSFAVATRGSSSRGPRTGANRRSRLWYRTMASFVAAARGEGPPIATGRDGLAVQRILEAAYGSRPS